jgi:hypothetical protein
LVKQVAEALRLFLLRREKVVERVLAVLVLRLCCARFPGARVDFDLLSATRAREYEQVLRHGKFGVGWKRDGLRRIPCRTAAPMRIA